MTNADTEGQGGAGHWYHRGFAAGVAKSVEAFAAERTAKEEAQAEALRFSAYAKKFNDEMVDFAAALQSIADNTCCGKCQEAALVARAALRMPPIDGERLPLTPEEERDAEQWAREEEAKAAASEDARVREGCARLCEALGRSRVVSGAAAQACADAIRRFADPDGYAVRETNARLKQALALVLPMAKGYADQHRVGSNASYIKEAEAALVNLPPANPV